MTLVTLVRELKCESKVQPDVEGDERPLPADTCSCSEFKREFLQPKEQQVKGKIRVTCHQQLEAKPPGFLLSMGK